MFPPALAFSAYTALLMASPFRLPPGTYTLRLLTNINDLNFLLMMYIHQSYAAIHRYVYSRLA
jgi:hypothetical protein